MQTASITASLDFFCTPVRTLLTVSEFTLQIMWFFLDGLL